MRRTIVPLVAVTLALLLTDGAAFAYFTATSSGSATGSVGTAQATAVTATTFAADGGLYPGGPAAAVHFTVDNPNAYAVSFSGWSGAAVSGVTPVSGTCTTGDFQIAAASGTFSSALSIPARTATASGVSGTAASVVQLNATAENGCQSAAVTVTLTLTGGQGS